MPIASATGSHASHRNRRRSETCFTTRIPGDGAADLVVRTPPAQSEAAGWTGPDPAVQNSGAPIPGVSATTFRASLPMPLVCPQCHTENSEQLRVCIACGATLPLPAKPTPPAVDHGRDSDTFDALYAPTLMMGAAQGAGVDPEGQTQASPRARAQTHAPRMRRRRPVRRMVGVAASLAIVAGAAWWWASQRSVPDAAALPGTIPSAAQASAAASASGPGDAAAARVQGAAASAAASAAAPSQPSSTPASAPVARVAPVTPVASAPVARALGVVRPSASGTTPSTPVVIERITASRPAPRTIPAAASASFAAAGSTQEMDTAVGTEPTSALPVAMAPSMAPASRPTAQQVCASRHFLLRPFCESSECGKAEHADEAHCKAIKDQTSRRPER